MDLTFCFASVSKPTRMCQLYAKNLIRENWQKSLKKRLSAIKDDRIMLPEDEDH